MLEVVHSLGQPLLDDLVSWLCSICFAPRCMVLRVGEHQRVDVVNKMRSAQIHRA